MLCRCFEVKADKYTYSMCPFGEATQKEGGGSTRLGTWQGFGDNYTTMLFDKGMGCWQGPARSFQVALTAPQPAAGQLHRCYVRQGLGMWSTGR